MANASACPFPFIDARLFPPNEGYVEGRLCGTIPLPGQKPGADCCLPCPGQDYYLHPSILTALHWNDIANVIGVGVGAFVLLVLTDDHLSHVDRSRSYFFLKRLPIGVPSASQFPLRRS